jgi:putative transposase
MQLVERHVVLDGIYEEICRKSGLLYNWVTYYYRQVIFGQVQPFGEYELSGLCAEYEEENYKALPAQSAQQVIKQVFQAFKSWRLARKAYEADPSQFRGRPKIPTYKTGKKQNIITFTNQNARLKNGYIYFPKNAGLKPIKTKVQNFQQVRIVPQATCHIVEIVYEQPVVSLNLNPRNVLSIDLGLNNYATCVNNVGNSPFFINGRIMKSFNHWFNKKRANWMSFIGNKGTSKRLEQLNNYRNCWIEDKNHKISREVVDYCVQNDIGHIIIGKNEGWKTGINLGKKTNQKFVELPHAKLIQKMEYKAKLVGIQVTLTEESYTSKIDHLAGETMQHHDEYLGRRVKRGLFQSSTGKMINADVNGAIGIGLKVLSNLPTGNFLNAVVHSGQVFCPKSINIC